MKQKQQIIKSIEENMGKPFWDIKYMNFIMAFTQFMDYHNVEIYESEIEEGEREEFVEEGIKKIRSSLKLKDDQLVIIIKAHQDGQWLFEFERLVDTAKETTTYYTKKVENSYIATVNGKKCVILLTEIASEDTEVYAIPVEIAEQLMIPDYDGEEITTNETFLREIMPYKLERYTVHNYD